MEPHRSNAHAFDLLAERHDAFAFTRCDLYTARVAGLLAAYLPPYPALRILDLGSGSGDWAARLVAQGHQVVLTDISFQMLKYAQKHLQQQRLAQLVCMDANAPAVCPNQWDAFLAIGDLLSYMSDPIVLLKQLVKISHRQTLFLGTVISRFGLALKQVRGHKYLMAREIIESGQFTERTINELAELAVQQNMAAPTQALQVHSYTASELSSILSAAGLNLLTLQGINVIKCITGAEVESWSQANVLEAERWLSVEEPWRDFSTNLFFAASL
jgi:2-polyprenyl-3-methyl-5-hydroxy-6-metoxy-1,4-benzoquinol methylase